ncbi:MAG TPA: hypothetical protein DCW68_07705 [Rhodospirillaceae bacterium]|nr:MAG: hypothetical protein A2018_08075 [Alphaproteobacteria bacterium GWF2_58_20]HAU29972.1 hypothetical protein [Rhodospirillaceae bacterium]
MRKHLPFQSLSACLLALFASGILASPSIARAQESASAGTGMDCSDPACAELCAKAKEGMEAQFKATAGTVKPAESVTSSDKSCFGSITMQVPQDLQAPSIDGNSLLDGLMDQACDKANELLGSLTDKIGELSSLSNLDIGNLGSSGLGDIFSGGSGALQDWLGSSISSSLPDTSSIIKTTVSRSVRAAPASTQGTGVSGTTSTPASSNPPAQQNDLINLFR